MDLLAWASSLRSAMASGIDLDHCITDAGSLSELAAEIIGYAETYAEISPSGEGIRLFARGSLDAPLANAAPGIEVYGTGRFLTVTGNKMEDAPDAVNEAPRTLARLKAAFNAGRVTPHRKTDGKAVGSSHNFFGNV